MKPRPGQHERFRELVSARVDGPLTVLAERQLLRHLAACAQCRAVQNDFYQQRRQLRALPPVPAPRDLWARTAAALDREMARQPARWDTDRPRLLPRNALVVTAAALGVAMALSSAQLGFVPQPRVVESPRAVLPTPFDVAPQRISFLGADANGVVLLRTQLDQVCPPSALGCIAEEDLSPQIIGLPHNVIPANVSISPDGERMAITGRRSGGDGVFALVLAEPPPPTDPLPPTNPLPPTDAPPVPRVTTGATQPTDEPDAQPTDDPAPAPTGTVQPSPLSEPTAPTTPTLATVAILENVRMTGAPPGWSPDGDVLAFSAMPADRSRGPDVYVWREGDDVARPVTTDHGSYFASWAGGRIVVSRVSPADEPDGDSTVRTVVLDMETGEQREVAARDLWLPVVSPLGDRAVTWHGGLEPDESTVRLLSGALYLADWRVLDPFSQTHDDDEAAPETGEPSPEVIEPSPEASERLTTPTNRAPRPRPLLTLPPDEEETPTAQPSEQPDEAQPAPTDDESDPPTDVGPTVELLAVEPWRDAEVEPVLDWQVRWSNDGLAIGYWIADAAGASWGQLSVVAIEPTTGALADIDPLLGPTLARRSFTLGIDRVAWVGPTEAHTEGEVRIRTWGPAGEGGRRLPSLDLREVVPSF